MKRLRAEVGLTNALGGAVLLLGGILFEPPARVETTRFAGAIWGLIIVIPAWLTGVFFSHRLTRPLEQWLREGQAGEPAPDRVLRLLVAHPAMQATILLSLWLTTALGLAIADVVIEAEQPLREFLTTLGGVSVAGIVVSTLSFLTDQRILGPWYERFFAGRDPIELHLPSTRVRRRLLVVFVLGTAVPILLIAGVVSERLSDPTGMGDLEGIVWFLAAVGALTGLYLTLSVRHTITRPLEAMRWAAERVGEGDLSVSVPVESTDEFGELATAFNAMVDGLRQRQRVEDLLGRQVGAAVAGKIIEEGVSFAVERRVASVLFLDVQGFTGMAEELPPEEVVSMLNHVFQVAVREVNRNQGLVNKFLGDAVLAVFGAPLDDPHHAAHALTSARAIAADLKTRGIHFGIGISTGSLVAGNVGSARRFEYTVVGDAVNEAARLQELTRERDADVLVSGRTVDALGPGGPDGLVPLGEATLRGRTHPTALYALA